MTTWRPHCLPAAQEEGGEETTGLLTCKFKKRGIWSIFIHAGGGEKEAAKKTWALVQLKEDRDKQQTYVEEYYARMHASHHREEKEASRQLSSLLSSSAVATLDKVIARLCFLRSQPYANSRSLTQDKKNVYQRRLAKSEHWSKLVCHRLLPLPFVDLVHLRQTRALNSNERNRLGSFCFLLKALASFPSPEQISFLPPFCQKFKWAFYSSPPPPFFWFTTLSSPLINPSSQDWRRSIFHPLLLFLRKPRHKHIPSSGLLDRQTDISWDGKGTFRNDLTYPLETSASTKPDFFLHIIIIIKF